MLFMDMFAYHFCKVKKKFVSNFSVSTTKNLLLNLKSLILTEDDMQFSLFN